MASSADARLLPPVENVAAYEALWPDDGHFREAVHAIGSRHGVHVDAERYGTGTAVAYRLGEAVLKLYPPPYANDAALEREVLMRAAADPALPTPRVLGDGQQDGWSYLLMTRLSGEPLEDLASNRPLFLRRMEELGDVVRRMHALPASALPRADASWRSFRAQCRARAVAHNLERGLPSARRGELEAMIDDLDRDAEDEGPHVLLHSELGLGHVLSDGSRITGIFDFGEAREGPLCFDFAAVGLFVSRGDRAAFRAFLDGYGLSERGTSLIRRVMRHALLHPYGHLTFYLQRTPPPRPDDLWSAAEHWFGH